jgi:hypothetical protein
VSDRDHSIVDASAFHWREGAQKGTGAVALTASNPSRPRCFSTARSSGVRRRCLRHKLHHPTPPNERRCSRWDEEAKGPAGSILRTLEPVYCISNTDTIPQGAVGCAWQGAAVPSRLGSKEQLDGRRFLQDPCAWVLSERQGCPAHMN